MFESLRKILKPFTVASHCRQAVTKDWQIRRAHLFTAKNIQGPNVCFADKLTLKGDYHSVEISKREASDVGFQHDVSSFWRQTDRGVRNTWQRRSSLKLSFKVCRFYLFLFIFLLTGVWSPPPLPDSIAVTALLFVFFCAGLDLRAVPRVPDPPPPPPRLNFISFFSGGGYCCR